MILQSSANYVDVEGIEMSGKKSEEKGRKLLSRKEFEERFNDSQINSFFNNKAHFVNSKFDFYDFYGIEENQIRRIEDDIKSPYRIPEGSAALFALMIRCCNNARGYDERLQNRSRVNYFQYKQFLDSVDIEMDKPGFPAYQRAFIQLHRGYRAAKIMAILVPKVVELLSITMLSFLRLEQYSGTIESLKSFCVSLDNNLCKNIWNSWGNTPLNYIGATGAELDLYEKAEEKCKDMILLPQIIVDGSTTMPLGYNAFSIEKVIGLSFRFFSNPKVMIRLTEFDYDNKEYICDLFIKKQETALMSKPEDAIIALESVYDENKEAITNSIKDFDDKLKETAEGIFPGFMSHDHLLGFSELEFRNKLANEVDTTREYKIAENKSDHGDEEDPMRKAVNTFMSNNTDMIKKLEEKMNEMIAILLSTT